jgi:osmotically-inducible protein OsmY
VKAKLAAERTSNLTRVSVATADGTVSLTGIVPTVADRARAEEITRQVKGVRSVMNGLQIEK